MGKDYIKMEHHELSLQVVRKPSYSGVALLILNDVNQKQRAFV